jgi:CRISPR-associated protein Cmr6
MGKQKTHQPAPGGEDQAKPDQRLPLPAEVRTVYRSRTRCEHVGLWLDRYLPLNANTWELTSEAVRREGVRRLGRASGWQSQTEAHVSALHARSRAMLRSYEDRGFAAKHIEARPVWRFVVGLGAAHVLETAITLHRLFGVPIIPGSAAKGVAKAYAQLVEHRFDEDPELAAIFGTTDQAGSIIFLDAIPVETPQLKLDIMNPHYPAYYRTRGAQPPANWELPNPVFFLTVSETPYWFGLAQRPGSSDHLLDTAARWLKGALKELGVGAKTTAGYGLWELADQQAESPGVKEEPTPRQALPETPKPSAPEPLDHASSTTPQIPAQVVDNSRKLIRGRLLVKGYENDPVECGGVSNLGSFSPGTYIWVRPTDVDKKTRRIRKVSLVGIWNP